MADSTLPQRLEGYKTHLPADFLPKVMTLCDAKGIQQFADPIIHNIEGIGGVGTEEGMGEFHAGHIVSMILSTIFMMMKQHFPAPKVIAAIQVSPELLTAIISNPNARHDPLTYDFARIDEIGKSK